MNTRSWVLASIAVFVTLAVLEAVIHGALLQNLYQQTASVWRPPTQANQLMWLMWLGYAIFAPFFVWLYSKGVEKRKDALGQGLRFGLMLGLGIEAMNALIWYVVLPIPFMLAVAWFVAGTAVFAAAGVAAALIYKA
jgi:hypothetical protein